VRRAAEWSEVATRLAASRSYWLHTTDPDGSPHAAPVWGAVTAEVLYLYSERSTVKARNLAHDQRVVLHLPDPDDCLIVHGTMEDLGLPQDHPDAMAAFDAAYPDAIGAGLLPSGNADFDVLWALRPSRALIWQLADWDGSQAIWRATA
jgi:Pyridoxamine 5'-phosphate oxidase